jgi:hypothetical protein
MNELVSEIESLILSPGSNEFNPNLLLDLGRYQILLRMIRRSSQHVLDTALTKRPCIHASRKRQRARITVAASIKNAAFSALQVFGKHIQPVTLSSRAAHRMCPKNKTRALSLTEQWGETDSVRFFGCLARRATICFISEWATYVGQ